MRKEAIKPHLCNEVRRLFGLNQESKQHFTRPEMLEMVSKIKNVTTEDISWEGCSSFMEEELYELGWEPQETVDTHPTIANLNWLISKRNTNLHAEAKKQNSQVAYTNTTDTFTKWAEVIESFNLNPKEITIDNEKIVIKF